MLNENEEQIATAAHTAEAEKVLGEKTAEISLGKFKDVNALLNAYNSLQSEFTKRSQRLKELEGKLASEKTEGTAVCAEEIAGEAATPKVPDTTSGESETSNGISDEKKSEILKDYLKGVVGLKQQAVVMDGVGVGVKTPSDKPKNIFEAGLLAKEIFLSK